MCEAALRVATNLLAVGLFLGPVVASGQSVVSPPGQDPAKVVRVVAFRLENQPAGDAIEAVRSLLSPKGRVELQGDSNTLILRDVSASVRQARAWLERFDHPKVRVGFTIRLVAAAMGEKPSDAEIPSSLLDRLNKILRYERFDLIGKAEIVGLEGQEISYRVDAAHRVDFRVGTVLDEKRIKLHDFQIHKVGSEGQALSLIHTHLVLRLGQTLVLGLARSEESDHALMVVVDSTPEPIKNNVISPVLVDNPKSQ